MAVIIPLGCKQSRDAERPPVEATSPYLNQPVRSLAEYLAEKNKVELPCDVQDFAE